MADPRFYDNRGPFGLAEICAKAGIGAPSDSPSGVSGEVFDLASLDGAGPDAVVSQHDRAVLEPVAVGFVHPPGVVTAPIVGVDRPVDEPEVLL